MKKVYFISGLGADQRAFNFLNLQFCEPVFVSWITPLPDETLQSYALRLYDSCIHDEQATIVGLSFGGMLAVEIANKHPQVKVIIISSCKTYKEIPAYLRFWRRLPVYKYIGGSSMKASGKIVLKLLGSRGEKQKQLQLEILKSSNPPFTSWAMDAIVHWKNTTVPANITHIHGTADKLLPFRYVKADYSIVGGEHVLIMDRADEVTKLLEQLIVTNA